MTWPYSIECKCCGEFHANNYVTIEIYANDTSETEKVAFVDMCKDCVTLNGDKILLNAMWQESDKSCIYCKKFIKNELGENITGLTNAIGHYCALVVPGFVHFMHVECYEKNIGL